LEGSNFWIGFLLGFLTAGVVGFMLAQARFFWKRVGQVGKTQTVPINTKESPLQVFMKGMQSCLILFLMLAALLMAIWLLVQG
jgi:hypothetical protein